jgi:hypothetical protein
VMIMGNKRIKARTTTHKRKNDSRLAHRDTNGIHRPMEMKMIIAEIVVSSSIAIAKQKISFGD